MGRESGGGGAYAPNVEIIEIRPELAFEEFRFVIGSSLKRLADGVYEFGSVAETSPVSVAFSGIFVWTFVCTLWFLDFRTNRN